MSRLCLVDFDDTLIDCDSFKSIMIHEGWLCSPKLVAKGVKLFLCKLTGKDTLAARSEFKKVLLKKYALLPDTKKEEYFEAFRSKINPEVISAINDASFDHVIIISASEEELIRSVIADRIPAYDVIANPVRPGEEFITCYGREKLRRLAETVPDYESMEITVYTDSYSDKPLIDIAAEAFMVSAGIIKQIR